MDVKSAKISSEKNMPKKKPPKVFLDANILFAAAYSARGGSRKIIRKGIASELIIVVSSTVLEEAIRNLEQKAPTAVESFMRFVGALNPQITEEPSKKEMGEVSQYLNPEDAIVLAAAIKAGVGYFVTLDKKHFLKDPQVEKKARLKILSPRQFLKENRPVAICP
jgi:predicted nucleic acid-binding protein